MKRGDRTDIEWAIDRLTSTAMKWYYWRFIAPGDYAVKERMAEETLESLIARCRRLHNLRNRNRSSTRSDK